MTVTGKDLNVGIVHDWLPTLGGAEKVVQQLTDLYPNSEGEGQRMSGLV